MGRHTPCAPGRRGRARAARPRGRAGAGAGRRAAGGGAARRALYVGVDVYSDSTIQTTPRFTTQYTLSSL